MKQVIVMARSLVVSDDLSAETCGNGSATIEP
jgi:hypothetical protein